MTVIDLLNKIANDEEVPKKIPEKIEEEEIEISMAIGEQICANKINEIIDYINKIKKEKDEIVQYACDLEDKICYLRADKNKAIEKIESVRVFNLKSGRTLLAALLNDIIDTLKGEDNE